MSLQTRAAVLISGNGSNLQAIIDAVAEQRLDLHLALVISNRDNAYGLTRARQAGIPVVVLKHQGESREEYDRKLDHQLRQAKINLVILAGFLRILSDEFVQRHMGQLVNIHPSLLPRHKGLNTHRRVLQAGDKTHGATVHFVVPELDAGPIILQASLQVNADDNEQKLAQRVLQLEHMIYPMALQWIVHSQVKLVDGKLVKNDGDLPQLISF